MADRKISDLTALTTPASGDFLPIVDISEAAAATKNKRITVEELMRGMPDGTAAAPGIAFENDPNTGIYSPGADQVAISTGGTGRLFVDASGNVGIGLTPTEQLTVYDSFNGISVVGGFKNISNVSANTAAAIELSADQSTSRITTLRDGVGNSATTVISNTAGGVMGERLRIDSSGRLLIGTSTSVNTKYDGSAFAAEVQLAGTGVSAFSLVRYGANADGSSLTLGKSRGALNAQSSVIADETLGYIGFTGSDGANPQTAATIRAQVDGTPGTNDMPGRLVFSTTADGAASPTERLRIESSGRVGIGTSSPADLLHINGGQIRIQRDVPQILFRSSDGASNQYYIGANISNAVDGGFIIGKGPGVTGGTPRIAIDSAGNVGVGLIPSANYGREIAVSGDLLAGVGSFGVRNLASNTNVTYWTNNAKNTGAFSDQYWVNAGATKYEQQASGAGAVHAWFSADAGSSGGGISWLERARIDSSGRLLVGTSSSIPGAYNGNGKFQSISTSSAPYYAGSFYGYHGDSNATVLQLGHSRSSTPGHTILQNGDGIGTLRFEGSDGVGFIEGAQIRAQVDGTPGTNDMPGCLVFSTTADGAASPTERMRIDNAGFTNIYGNNTVFAARSGAAAGTSQSLYGGYHSATSTSDGTASYAVWTNGNVVNTNNSYGAISDIKLKENIVDANSQWNDLKALQVRNYNFKEGQTHTQIGLVAQEVELVSPGLVTESPDRDAEGNDLGTVTKSVNYSVLYMKAVKALQEAMERIETLEARLTAAGID